MGFREMSRDEAQAALESANALYWFGAMLEQFGCPKVVCKASGTMLWPSGTGLPEDVPFLVSLDKLQATETKSGPNRGMVLTGEMTVVLSLRALYRLQHLLRQPIPKAGGPCTAVLLPDDGSDDS